MPSGRPSSALGRSLGHLPPRGKATLFSRLKPVLPHTAAGLAGAFVVQVVGKARGGGVPGKSLGFGFKLDLGVPEGRGQVGIHAVDLNPPGSR